MRPFLPFLILASFSLRFLWRFFLGQTCRNHPSEALIGHILLMFLFLSGCHFRPNCRIILVLLHRSWSFFPLKICIFACRPWSRGQFLRARVRYKQQLQPMLAGVSVFSSPLQPFFLLLAKWPFFHPLVRGEGCNLWSVVTPTSHFLALVYSTD